MSRDVIAGFSPRRSATRNRPGRFSFRMWGARQAGNCPGASSSYVAHGAHRVAMLLFRRTRNPDESISGTAMTRFGQ